MPATKMEAARCKAEAVRTLIAEAKECIGKARAAVGQGDYGAAALALMYAEDPMDALAAYEPLLCDAMRAATARTRKDAFDFPEGRS